MTRFGYLTRPRTIGYRHDGKGGIGFVGSAIWFQQSLEWGRDRLVFLTGRSLSGEFWSLTIRQLQDAIEDAEWWWSQERGEEA